MPTDTSNSAAEHDGGVLFEALIVPHRSLSPAGRQRLMLALGGLCALIAFRFGLLGAWPVLGFAVLEGALVLSLVHLNARRARASELVLLSADGLRVVRTTPSGARSEVVLSSGWLNVILEEPAGRVPRLLVGVRSRRVEIGAVLGEAEKRALAAALRGALHRARHPTFANAHLDQAGIRAPAGPSTS